MRLRLSSSSRRLPWLPRPRLFLTPGSATRARLSSDSRRSWLLPSSPRSRRSSRTPRSCSRFCSRASPTLRVRGSFQLPVVAFTNNFHRDCFFRQIDDKKKLLESRFKVLAIFSFCHEINPPCAYNSTCAISQSIKTLVDIYLSSKSNFTRDDECMPS